MPSLDPSNVLVTFLEMQPEIIASSGTQFPASLRRSAAATKAMANALDIPVIASVVSLQGREPRLIEELASLEPLARTTISLLKNGAAWDRVAQFGRRTLVIAGMSMEIAVLHTVLDARRAGFNVHLLVDCCGGLSVRSEAAALTAMEVAGAEISNISSFFTGLIDDVDSTDGRAVMKALAELWSWNTAQ